MIFHTQPPFNYSFKHGTKKHFLQPKHAQQEETFLQLSHIIELSSN